MSITLVKSPVVSPSLAEAGPAILTDEHGNQVELFVAATVDANGHLALPTGSGVVTPGSTSQVTAKQGTAVMNAPGGFKIPVKALCSFDSSGNPIAFAPAAAKSVSGKFQSVEETGTGSQQSIPHGLGATPTLVLCAPYDNTASGSTPFTFQIAEGTHDATNVYVTATSGLKYKVIAFA